MTVYFIQVQPDGPIKIGFTSLDPRKRKRELQVNNMATLSLLAFFDGDKSREHEVHKQFAKDRIRGEWFEPSQPLLNFISGYPPAHTILKDRRGKQKNRRRGRTLSPELAKKYGKAGAKVRIANKVAKRMPSAQALKIWTRKGLSNAAALALMTGWSEGTAYRLLGPTGRPCGNPGNSETV